MGPAEHITTLFGELCTRWPRCEAQLQTSNKTGHDLFMQLLGHCSDWMTESEGLREVPSIFFHVAGANGERHTIELTSWAYIVEALQREVKVVTSKIMGVFPVEIWVPTRNVETVCVPQFGEQDYNTLLNGPVYVIGTPLFYEHQVEFQMNPPSIGFSKEACGSCAEGTAFVTSEDTAVPGVSRSPQHTNGMTPRPRRISGPPRVPKFDTTQPL